MFLLMEFQRVFAGWAWRCSLGGVSLAFSVAMVCGVRYRGCLWCEGRTAVPGKTQDITARVHTYVYMQCVKPSQLRDSCHALENQRKLAEIGRRHSQTLDATCYSAKSDPKSADPLVRTIGETKQIREPRDTQCCINKRHPIQVY